MVKSPDFDWFPSTIQRVFRSVQGPGCTLDPVHGTCAALAEGVAIHHGLLGVFNICGYIIAVNSG